eukprot:g76685.t1
MLCLLSPPLLVYCPAGKYPIPGQQPDCAACDAEPTAFAPGLSGNLALVVNTESGQSEAVLLLDIVLSTWYKNVSFDLPACSNFTVLDPSAILPLSECKRSYRIEAQYVTDCKFSTSVSNGTGHQAGDVIKLSSDVVVSANLDTEWLGVPITKEHLLMRIKSPDRCAAIENVSSDCNQQPCRYSVADPALNEYFYECFCDSCHTGVRCETDVCAPTPTCPIGLLTITLGANDTMQDARLRRLNPLPTVPSAIDNEGLYTAYTINITRQIGGGDPVDVTINDDLLDYVWSEAQLGAETVVNYRFSDGTLPAFCSFRVKVREAGKPNITCPADKASRSVVTWLPPQTDDNVDASLTVTQHPSNLSSVSTEGSFTIAYTAQDSSGNNASCNFTIVYDVTPPVYDSCPVVTVTVPTDTPEVNYYTMNSSAWPWTAPVWSDSLLGLAWGNPGKVYIGQQKVVTRIKVRAISYGGTGGGQQEDFVLEQEEFLTEVLVRQGPLLHQIVFVTSKGRPSPTYGGTEGAPYEFKSTKPIVGLKVLYQWWSVVSQVTGIETADMLNANGLDILKSTLGATVVRNLPSILCRVSTSQHLLRGRRKPRRKQIVLLGAVCRLFAQRLQVFRPLRNSFRCAAGKTKVPRGFTLTPTTEWNDKISSLEVPPGGSVALFDQSYYEGASKTFCQDISYLNSHWNNKASSIKVKLGSGGGADSRSCVPDPAGCVLQNAWSGIFTVPEGAGQKTYFPVWYRMEDMVGNSEWCGVQDTVLDTAPPVLTCPPNLTVHADKDSNKATLEFVDYVTAIDNVGVVSLTWQPMATITRPDGDPHSFTLTATDAASNNVSCHILVKVVDNQLPNISCPADMDVPMDAGMTTYSVAEGFPWADPVPSDNDEIETVYPSFGSEGNATVLSKGSNVLLSLTMRPLAIADFTAEGSSVVSAVDNDALDPAFLSSNRLDGALLAWTSGEETVSVYFTFQDASGNQANCSFEVDVQDNQAPTIYCSDKVFDTDINSLVYTATAWTFAVDDNADKSLNWTQVSYNPSSLQFQLGSTYVTGSVTDEDGNTGECTFRVQVNQRCGDKHVLNGEECEVQGLGCTSSCTCNRTSNYFSNEPKAMSCRKRLTFDVAGTASGLEILTDDISPLRRLLADDMRNFTIDTNFSQGAYLVFRLCPTFNEYSLKGMLFQNDLPGTGCWDFPICGIGILVVGPFSELDWLQCDDVAPITSTTIIGYTVNVSFDVEARVTILRSAPTENATFPLVVDANYQYKQPNLEFHLRIPFHQETIHL